MKLLEIQKNFQNYILHQKQEIAKDVVKPERGEAAERLEIYADAYFFRLLEVLSVEFPKCYIQLGRKQFENVVKAYFDLYPSKFYTVRHVGYKFPEFLKSYFSKKPYLSELAQFETHLSDLVETTDTEIATVEKLAAIPPEQWGYLTFKFHPSVVLQQCQWDVISAWRADKPIPPRNRKQYVLFWRKHIAPFYLEVKEKEFWLANAILENQNFAYICQGLSRWLPETQIAQFALDTLVKWLNSEMFTEINSIVL